MSPESPREEIRFTSVPGTGTAGVEATVTRGADVLPRQARADTDVRSEAYHRLECT